MKAQPQYILLFLRKGERTPTLEHEKMAQVNKTLAGLSNGMAFYNSAMKGPLLEFRYDNPSDYTSVAHEVRLLLTVEEWDYLEF